MTDHQRRIDRILAPGYLADLSSRSDDELRAMREECAEVETEYSYLRRLAQARIAILEAERERRASGAPLADLVAQLPHILADAPPRPDQARGRLPMLLAPKKLDGYSRGLERLVEDDTLAKLPQLGDDDLAESLEQLQALEREVSDVRRTLHRAIDAIGAEIGARAASGA